MSANLEVIDDERSLWRALLGDGRFLLALTGVALIASGGFALFLSATGHFLPHDVARLGLDAPGLSRLGNPALVNFMFHDRAAFGGALIAIGCLYLWIVEFPLRRGEAWAWWTLAVSGVSGFGSFLTYLGYGYLDTWHGVATLFLLPVYLAGMLRSWRTLRGEKSWRALRPASSSAQDSRSYRAGKRLLLVYAAGLTVAGATIMTVGMTSVFVPEDLEYIGLTRVEICGIADPLIPIIAHDRAGFGGGLLSIGLTLLFLILHARPVRSFRQIMLVAGVSGFSCAIGIHFIIGYTNLRHLAPAFVGGAIFLVGWWLMKQPAAAPDLRVAPAPSELIKV
ncbi:MAG: hypothetical protein ABIZ04_08640 [Opitutus sp.]